MSNIFEYRSLLLWMAANHRLTGWSVSWNITEPAAIAADYLRWPNQIVALVAGKPGDRPGTIPICQAMLNVPRVATWQFQI